MESKAKKFKKGNEKDTLLSSKEWNVLRKDKQTEKRKKREEMHIKEYEELKKSKEEKILQGKEKQEQQNKQETLGRNFTLSVALPGSILDNAQSPELRTYLAGQIARAAVVFNIDEVIIFDETNTLNRRCGKNGCLQMARILQYLECPQYLRKIFFPQHRDLQYAGLLNPLDCPHHMRASEECKFREGAVLDKPVKEGKGSFANVGLQKKRLDRVIFGHIINVLCHFTGTKKRIGTVVHPETPRTEEGLYWGYQVRLAKSLGAVFVECPFTDGYDLSIGTSERGESVDALQLSHFKHGLVVFGGLQGLEASLEADESLEEDDPSLLFQHYINSCPTQGSRTIRTEPSVSKQSAQSGHHRSKYLFILQKTNKKGLRTCVTVLWVKGQEVSLGYAVKVSKGREGFRDCDVIANVAQNARQCARALAKAGQGRGRGEQQVGRIISPESHVRCGSGQEAPAFFR
ncbi:hypothetical protein C0Q70_11407 [Pomacea canaliculata]|uniref:SPOUT domain containing methyltransferase 1 n=1 Tax=Pomacea canaliculata TaxID=400727 RepID=A0A2T7P5V4_POMCA|nr:hypothetical protein C0Q70_11407 [Pomacea canaliculata]